MVFLYPKRFSMRMWKFLMVMSFIYILGDVSLLQAQPSGSLYGWQSFIGINGGYGYSLQSIVPVYGHSGMQPITFPSTFLPVIRFGIAFETVGVVNHYHMGWSAKRWEKTKPSWLFQCEYTYTAGNLNQKDGSSPVLQIFFGDTVMKASTFNANVSLSVVQIDILRKYRLRESGSDWTPFYVAFGPTIRWAMSGTMQQSVYLQNQDLTTTLIPEEGVQIDEQGQRATFEKQILPVKNSLNFGAKVGLLYEHKLISSSFSHINPVTVVPSLWIEYPITNVQGDYSWKAFSTHLDLSILFSLNNPVAVDDGSSL